MQIPMHLQQPPEPRISMLLSKNRFRLRIWLEGTLCY